MTTITRALAEVKLLDKRIEKVTRECYVIRIRSNSDKWNLEEFKKEAQGDYASVIDLIKRRQYLKFKILESNAKTKVQIGSNEYTIVEVLELKNSIKYKKEFLSKLRDQRFEVDCNMKCLMDENQKKLDKLLEVNFGKDNKSNSDSNHISIITKSYFDSHKVEIIDPINISDKIKSLDDEILEFEKEVDLVLSESNARTLID